MRSSQSVAYAPRGMRAEDAARYVGMSRSKFMELVDSGRMPVSFAIDGMRMWDRSELDAAFDALKERGVRPNTIHARLGIGK